jgi:hypothetical protein
MGRERLFTQLEPIQALNVLEPYLYLAQDPPAPFRYANQDSQRGQGLSQVSMPLRLLRQ